MGLTRRDDYANQVGALTREFPQLTLYLGGHTHQNHSSESVNDVLYTQADHYGIYAGKVDLTFDRATRRLLAREAFTVRMDHHRRARSARAFALPKPNSTLADQLLAREIGELTEPFGTLARASAGRANGTAHRQRHRRGVAQRRAWKSTPSSTASSSQTHLLPRAGKPWPTPGAVLPYENQIVTVELSYPDLLALAQEFSGARDPRPIMGLRVIGGRNRTRPENYRVAQPGRFAFIGRQKIPARPQFLRFAIGRRPLSLPGAAGGRSRQSSQALSDPDPRCAHRFLPHPPKSGTRLASRLEAILDRQAWPIN